MRRESNNPEAGELVLTLPCELVSIATAESDPCSALHVIDNFVSL